MLSNKDIRSAKPKQTVYRLRDGKGGVRGFGVAIAPSGTKTFFLSFTSPSDGKRKQVAIGKFGAMTLSSARSKAVQIRDQINSGEDPAALKAQSISAKIEQRTLGTLGDLIDLYAQDLQQDGKRAAKEVLRIRNKDVSPALLTRKANSITKDDILDILAPISQRGALIHSDNVRAYLRAAFELGINVDSMPRWRGKCPKFDLVMNPVATVKKTVSRKPVGKRALARTEVAALWNASDLSEAMLLAMQFLLATGQRVEEVLHARWDEFDLAEKLWVIPSERRKTRGTISEPHIIPLTGLHLSLLQAIKDATNHDVYLFPAKRGDAPRRYDALTKAVSRYVQTSGMEKFSPRDMRRTFKTIAGSMGISLELRNRLQGHALTDVGSVHYDRYDYLAEKRTAMETWAKGLAVIVKETDQ